MDSYSPEQKTTTFIDSSLMSGSDRFRTAAGEFYELSEEDELSRVPLSKTCRPKLHELALHV